jgi:hypothetical protein
MANSISTVGGINRPIALMMEAVSTSETSVNFYRLHGTTSQKKVIFILATMRT